LSFLFLLCLLLLSLFSRLSLILSLFPSSIITVCSVLL
jgi:hypothetical protein